MALLLSPSCLLPLAWKAARVGWVMGMGAAPPAGARRRRYSWARRGWRLALGGLLRALSIECSIS
jgi:hypothetical protein